MELTTVYDQVWDWLRDRTEAWIPRHVQTYIEEAFQRRATREYDLPREADLLRREFRQFALRESTLIAQLLVQDRKARARNARRQQLSRRPRRANPETRNRARELLAFVAQAAVPIGALGRGSLRLGRCHSEMVRCGRDLIEFQRTAVPWAALWEQWNEKHPKWRITSPASLKVRFFNAARDPNLASEAVARVQRDAAEEMRAILMRSAHRMEVLQRAGVVPPRQYLAQLPGSYGFHSAVLEWHAAGRPVRPPAPAPLPPGEAAV